MKNDFDDGIDDIDNQRGTQFNRPLSGIASEPKVAPLDLVLRVDVIEGNIPEIGILVEDLCKAITVHET
jgi:hypothetical protein